MPHPDHPPAGELVLQPFRAVRYNAGVVGDISRVLSPPYDVIDGPTLDALEAASDVNVVRLILPRSRDGAGDQWSADYPLARDRFRRWQEEGVLRTDDTPALYVYEQSSAEHVQRGLVGAVGLRPPEAGVILPHENTMAGPVSDRLALMEATRANLEAIILVYEGGPETRAAVGGVDGSAPLVDVRSADGWRHRMWALTDPDLLSGIAGELAPRRAVIADGHHRYTTYLRYQAEQQAAGGSAGPWDFGLALLVDGTSFGPQVHPIHRVVAGLPASVAAERAAAGFHVTAMADLAAAEQALGEARTPAYALTDGESAWLLDDPDPGRLDAALPADRSAAWRGLDVAIAHELLIKDLWGLSDTEDVVGYQHDVPSTVAAARAARGVALLLRPTPVEAVTAVAAAGERMPRKSTLFTPKPASGLLMRDLRLA